jgi:hypothetical protein
MGFLEELFGHGGDAVSKNIGWLVLLLIFIGVVAALVVILP